MSTRPEANVGGPTTQHDLLGSLPAPLLDVVLSHLLTNGSACNVRATATWLRDAVDALNTRLSLGGCERPYEQCLLNDVRVAWQLEAEPAPSMRQRLVSLMRRTPCITSLAIRPQLRWLSCTDALATGGQHLHQSLTSLCLRGRQDVSDLQPLAACIALMHLDLSNCDALLDLSPLVACSALQHLQLNNCIGLEYLGTLASLSPTLRQIELNGCRNITDLPILTALTALSHLGLSECSAMGDLHFLENLTSLAHLSVRDCPDIQDLHPLASCLSLRYLNLHHCRGVTDLRPLASCTALSHLDCGLCSGVHDLQPLTACTALQYLDIGNARVDKLAPLAACANLQHLQLNGCMYVHDLHPLAACTALRHVDIRACGKIKDYSPLEKVRRVLRAEPVISMMAKPNTGPSCSHSGSAAWDRDGERPGLSQRNDCRVLQKLRLWHQQLAGMRGGGMSPSGSCSRRSKYGKRTPKRKQLRRAALTQKPNGGSSSDSSSSSTDSDA